MVIRRLGRVIAWALLSLCTTAGLTGTAYAGSSSGQPASTTQAAASWPYGCPAYHFCMYRKPNYQGTPLKLYYCDEIALSNWVGFGSYVNNQIPYSQITTYFKRQDHSIYGTSVSGNGNPNFDWTPVWYVDPC